MQETWVQSWGQEDPLEKETETQSLTPVFLPGKSHGQSSLTDYSLGAVRVAHDLVTIDITYM